MNWRPQKDINRNSFPEQLDCVIPAHCIAKKSGKKRKKYKKFVGLTSGHAIETLKILNRLTNE